MYLVTRKNINKFIKISIILLTLSINSAYSLDNEENNSKTNSNPIKNHYSSNKNKTPYIIGSGDTIRIELEHLPELSTNVSVGPDGYIYIPELKNTYVEGLTLEELENDLLKRYSVFVRYPKISIRIIAYRPVKTFIAGEVKRPGLYTLSGINQAIPNEVGTLSTKGTGKLDNILMPAEEAASLQLYKKYQTINFPTLFDAIRISQGITPFTDLSNIQIKRKNPITNGGGYIKTTINLMPLILEGDQSQNIRIFDGDIIKIGKSEKSLNKQILEASVININPDSFNVFISGQAEKSGRIAIRNGRSLNEAIAASGGKKIFSGDISFIRFYSNGEIDKRKFNHMPTAKPGSPNNPILISGDIIHINRSPVGYLTESVSTITRPVVGIYSLLNLFD
ncbi:polysaccharide biosynthesis/export family protein [Prochlorococcus marinus]|uniref:polysaccharide biosynthesis/export family protein n=1 Tax=Prochlorococcus marinus TaxID=1219 RepID=UPI0022B2D491|nr:polysaccharide biosynthesis/export family protein [Prochlorococcus marinus]